MEYNNNHYKEITLIFSEDPGAAGNGDRGDKGDLSRKGKFFVLVKIISFKHHM